MTGWHWLRIILIILAAPFITAAAAHLLMAAREQHAERHCSRCRWWERTATGELVECTCLDRCLSQACDPQRRRGIPQRRGSMGKAA